ncbi:LacI family DNA-binding transcriptional regulator [Kaistia dalseonensis]|uniref:LacI family transcriptional regulator n=1 Tax=Kaistia dalseonensis TaxID=410840 RepID=A0ABU0H4X1_9HYPH|nr:LacI family DNA-binding transcriptional regulator [Kaistia dalseonensis]MCX5494761.1 LacI family DNA-binding transcriptional regulator [Kaistia dalseonensis]MDQ0437342.1 LacI family transcriptional regulator [Kaistia dalseonensis]
MSDEDLPQNGTRRRAATIADVAEAAGVAIGTVSRFLNGREIRRGNREQIEAAIEKLSYRRNAVAAAMKTDKTHMIGLLIPTFDEFHSDMVEHLARLLRTSGRALVIYCHSHDARVINDALDFFDAQRVDALIMDGVAEVRARLEQMTADGVPIVFYNNDIPGIAADRVMVENSSASYRAVSHLLDLRHERVAIIAGAQYDSSGRQRLEGYEAALHDRGIPIDPAYVVEGTWRPDSGYDAARQLMQLDKPPTAVFVSNYGMTIGVLEWMRDNGLRVPDDLSLVSFDDVALFRLREPAITAISQPIAAIAESIATLIVSRLDPGKSRPLRSVVLKCDVILRGSTRRWSPAD